jgi:RNA polymerase sigma-70 factor, ECF subfamily
MSSNETETEASFKKVFSDTYSDIAAYLLRRLPFVDVDETAADVFATAWLKWDKRPSDELQVRPWLFGIAHNHLRNRHRFRRRQQRTELRIQNEMTAAQTSRHGRELLESLGDDSIKVAIMLRTLATLKRSDQEILRLHAWEDLSTSELAIALDCAEGTARVRLHRAKQRLAKAIERTQSNTIPTTKEVLS